MPISCLPAISFRRHRFHFLLLKKGLDNWAALPLSWPDMNKSPVAKVLLFIVAVLSVWSLVLCWTYFNRARQLQDMQIQVYRISQAQQGFQMLLNESAEYSKTHPAMDTLLRSIPGIQAAPSAAQKNPTNK